MPELVVAIGLVTFVVGVTLGWYLRRINAWCPRCGNSLTCTTCGERPAWSTPPRAVRNSGSWPANRT